MVSSVGYNQKMGVEGISDEKRARASDEGLTDGREDESG